MSDRKLFTDRNFKYFSKGEARKVIVHRVRCEQRPAQAFTDEEGFHVPVYVVAEMTVDGYPSLWPTVGATGFSPTIGMVFKNKGEWDEYRDEFHRRLAEEVENLKTKDFRDV